MKFFNKFYKKVTIITLLIAIILIVILPNTISLKISVKENQDSEETPPETPTENPPATEKAANDSSSNELTDSLRKYYEILFKDPTLKSCPKKSNETEKKKDETIEKEKEREPLVVDGIVAQQPSKRPDYFSNVDMGFGKSAWLFDYLDELLRKPFLDEAAKIIAVVKAKPTVDPEGKYEDPYTLNKMLAIPLLNSPPEEDLIIKLKKLYKGFNDEMWKNSYNAVQIRSAIKEFKWKIPMTNSDPARYIIDHFDFNGDGRLNDSELIIAVIRSNALIWGLNKCKYCFEHIIDHYLDPMYMFMDADNSGKMDAEELWNAFKYLDRGSSNYDIYQCNTNGPDTRTDAINDFVIKASRGFPGSIMKKEFMSGLMLGLWTRQFDIDVNMLSDDSKCRKQDRWSEPTKCMEK